MKPLKNNQFNSNPGGVILEPNSNFSDDLNITNVSFSNGNISFSINDENKSVITQYNEEQIKEIYDLISNHNINYLYLDTNKQFVFICPEFLRNSLFHVEFEMCNAFSFLDKEYIGKINSDNKVIYGKPCTKSKLWLSFDDLVSATSNTLYFDFSQVEKDNDGKLTIQTSFSQLHHKYQLVLEKYMLNFDNHVKTKDAYRTINKINKIYQLLFLIHINSNHKIDKINNSYYATLDSFTFNNGNTDITAKPSC